MNSGLCNNHSNNSSNNNNGSDSATFPGGGDGSASSGGARRRHCIVAPMTVRSGNLNTAERIADYLNAAVVDSREPDVPSCVKSETFQSCVMLHALRSGRVVFPSVFAERGAGGGRGEGCPSSSKVVQRATISACLYVLVFGGTDVNEFSKTPQLREQMAAVIARVDIVVCFSETLRRAASGVWPALMASKRIEIVPQGVAPPLAAPLADRDAVLRRVLAECGAASLLNSNVSLVLWFGGLREVKDPMFVAHACEYAARHDCGDTTTALSSSSSSSVPTVLWLLIGPDLEERVSKEVSVAVTSFSAALHDEKKHLHHRLLRHPGVSRDEVAALMMSDKTLCVLNTSRSEGEPQTLLEAMGCRGLVAARNIDANREVVGEELQSQLVLRTASDDHDDDVKQLKPFCCTRGFLFNTPQDLGEIVRTLAKTHMSETEENSEHMETIRMHMKDEGEKYVALHHSVANERSEYLRICSAVLTSDL